MQREWERGYFILELEDGRTLKLTEDHPVLTKNRGWIKMEDIQLTDDIMVEEDLQRSEQVAKQWMDNPKRRKEQTAFAWRKLAYKNKGNAVKTECPYCGKEVKRRPSRIAKGREIYCDRKCFNQSGAMRRTLEKNPAWLGGKSFEPYTPEFNQSIKLRIKIRDHHKCQLCGTPEYELERSLSIHHIDYNKANSKENNLIALCHACHIKTNTKREYWLNYFKGDKIENKIHQ
jgi:5-methylcytosine-specific restriction endonuclease McrA